MNKPYIKFIICIDKWLERKQKRKLSFCESACIVSQLKRVNDEYDYDANITEKHLNLGSELAFTATIAAYEIHPELEAATNEKIILERKRVFEEIH